MTAAPSPMPSGAPSPSLAAVADRVPFLRARRGATEPGDLRAADLIAEPDALAAEIAATAEERGSDDPGVLASLWWQGYAYRTAGTTLAAWVVAGAAPDPAATAGGGVGVSRGRPSILLVGLDADELRDLSTVVDRLFAGHLDPLAESLRARHSIGNRLVWGNTAASVASCLGAVACADDDTARADDAAPVEGAGVGHGDQRPARATSELGPRIDEAVAALPHGIPALGTWLDPHRSYRRSTCCLWWKTTAAKGVLCSDCSLR